MRVGESGLLGNRLTLGVKAQWKYPGDGERHFNCLTTSFQDLPSIDQPPSWKTRRPWERGWALNNKVHISRNIHCITTLYCALHYKKWRLLKIFTRSKYITQEFDCARWSEFQYRTTAFYWLQSSVRFSSPKIVILLKIKSVDLIWTTGHTKWKLAGLRLNKNYQKRSFSHTLGWFNVNYVIYDKCIFLRLMLVDSLQELVGITRRIISENKIK